MKATITCNELHGTVAHKHRDIESDGFDLIKRQTDGGAGGAHEVKLPRRLVSFALTGGLVIGFGAAMGNCTATADLVGSGWLLVSHLSRHCHVPSRKALHNIVALALIGADVLKYLARVTCLLAELPSLNFGPPKASE
jgi:hypothetical protein